ncbi:hypothetical protein LINPERHAP1_LOCUS33496 [Linum perenne]
MRNHRRLKEEEKEKEKPPPIQRISQIADEKEKIGGAATLRLSIVWFELTQKDYHRICQLQYIIMLCLGGFPLTKL